MASIIKRPKNRKWLQFSFRGRRHTWRLGLVSLDSAFAAKRAVEQLIRSIDSGEPVSRDVQRWLSDITVSQRSKLEGFGLIQSDRIPRTIAPFIEFVLAEHYGNKAAGTKTNMEQAQKKILGFFAADQAIRCITTGDIKLYKAHLEGLELAPATVAVHLVKLRTFLSLAVQHGIIEQSPFKRIDLPSQANNARKVYVRPETIKKLLLHCNPYWQAAICLVRFGGVRAPSDVFGLTWERVNFENRVIVAARQKTSREIAFPMSIEIYHTLRQIYDASETLGPNVFPDAMVAYATSRGSYAQLKRLILRAGIEPWPVLWNSLRTSWGQDLKQAGISMQTRARWLDHTVAVDQQHYDLGPGDQEFQTAIKLNSGVF